MAAENLQEVWKPTINPWLGIIPLIGGTFMFALNETIANVALPYMAGSFSVSNNESIWILTIYLIASCIGIPMMGWATKMVGRKNLFIYATVLFTFSSLMCGLSNSMPMETVFRFLQGLGGGILLPLSQAIILENFKGEEQAKAIGLFGLMTVLAPVIGPVMGGWLTDNWSWPWVFYINIPIGIFTIITSIKFIEDPPYARKQKNVITDYWGIIFLVIWLVPFQTFLDKGNDKDWFGSEFICKLFIFAMIGFIGFIISQYKSKEPLIDLKIFKDMNFNLGTFILAVINAILLASLALLPQFLQTMMGYDAFTSGLSMMPRGVGCVVAMILYAKLVGKVDLKILVATGLFFLAIGSWNLGFINLEVSMTSVLIPNFLYGLGMILGMIPVINLSCITVKNEDMNNASAAQNLIKTVGGSIGTSLVATLISRYAQVHQYALVKHLNYDNHIYMTKLKLLITFLTQNFDNATAFIQAHAVMYKLLLQQSYLWAYIDTFRFYAVAGIVIIPLLIFMKSKSNDPNCERPMAMH